MNTAGNPRPIWIDWRRPALQGVVDVLVERHRRGDRLDLSEVVVVTPGLRSRQRLLELLVDFAADHRLVWTPPALLPLAALPARLIPEQAGPERTTTASAVQESLAWLRAVQQADRSWLPPEMIAQLANDRVRDWFPWVQMLQRLHGELASEGMYFDDVRRALAARQLFPDPAAARRWERLVEVQQAYFAELASWGCTDRQQLALEAVANRRCVLEQELYLIGTVDLRRNLRAMLAQVAGRVIPVIIADPQRREHFDALGCLVTDRWLCEPIGLPDAAVRIVDRPIDQAVAVIEVLADLPGPLEPDAITIGVPDLRIVPHLERRLENEGIRTRRLAGKPLDETLMVRLLAATCRYLESDGYTEFAAWVRHPDMFDYLQRTAGAATFLGELDRLQNELIPQEFDLRRMRTMQHWPQVAAIAAAAHHLLGPWRGGPRPLAAWGEICRDFLAKIYGDTPLESDDPVAAELVAAASVLQAHIAAVAQLPAADLPELSAVDALHLLLDGSGRESVAAPPVPGAVELTGWLDLPLDDAAVTIVTSLNDQWIPSAIDGDAFLTNSIRHELGMVDNDQRYARDAYHLGLLAASGRRLTVIACRHDTEHNPLLPSRLLFACDDATLVRRAQAFFDFTGPTPDGLWLTAKSDVPGNATQAGSRPPRQQQWPIPLPRGELARVEQLRVTDFKQFLLCPYRFFLSRVLRLQAASDDWREMPPYVFGQLTHDVLEDFACGPVAASDDAAQIEASLARSLAEHAIRRYGTDPAAAIRIQVEQVRMRLAAFATRQAAWRREGWQIIAAEVPDLEYWMQVDGEPFRIYGRIDRIDRNEQDGSFAIFDYKTADNPQTPHETHREGEAWIDLQLPLYRHLARHKFPELGPSCRLGYVLLPRSLGDINFSVADWSDAELADADATACEVIRRVRRSEFWPPADPPPYRDGEWARICQEHVAQRWQPAAGERSGS